jgi:hypothetical protein
MIIWRGYGFLVVLIALLVVLCANFLADHFGGDRYWESHSFPLGSALIVAGGLIWVIDSLLYGRPARTLIDEKTGERLVLVPRHDLFFLRMKWWAIIVLGFGVFVLATNFIPGK